MVQEKDFFYGFGILGLLFGLIVLVLYLWTIFWSYRDAKRRGVPGWLVAILVAVVSWPIGFLLWIIFRPKSYYRTD